jgi:hypothetical protein
MSAAALFNQLVAPRGGGPKPAGISDGSAWRGSCYRSRDPPRATWKARIAPRSNSVPRHQTFKWPSFGLQEANHESDTDYCCAGSDAGRIERRACTMGLRPACADLCQPSTLLCGPASGRRASTGRRCARRPTGCRCATHVLCGPNDGRESLYGKMVHD